MSDSSIRARRRVEDPNSAASSSVTGVYDHDTKKESAASFLPLPSSSFFGGYSALSSTVFGASPTQLWNSAQVCCIAAMLNGSNLRRESNAAFAHSLYVLILASLGSYLLYPVPTLLFLRAVVVRRVDRQGFPCVERIR